MPFATVQPFQRLPGVYHTVTSEPQVFHELPRRGTLFCMMPLPRYVPNEVTEILTANWRNQQLAFALTGMDSTPAFASDNRSMNAATTGARRIKIFPQHTGGTAASGTLVGAESEVVFTDLAVGEAGNKITWKVTERGGIFTVLELFNGIVVSTQRIISLHELESGLMSKGTFTLPDGFNPETDTLPVPIGQIQLSGGTNGTLGTFTSRQGAFQDAAAIDEDWDAIAFTMLPSETGFDAAVNLHKAWLDTVNNALPQRARASHMFISGDMATDHSNVYNWRQTLVFDGEPLNESGTVLYHAGRWAGADGTNDLGGRIHPLPRVIGVSPLYRDDQREEFLNRGFNVLHMNRGRAYIVREVTSFVTTRRDKTIQWTGGREHRIRDEWMQFVNNTFALYANTALDTEDYREDFKLTLSQGAVELFEATGRLDEHDTSKITVTGGERFKLWSAEYREFRIPGTPDTLDMHTRITI